MAHTKLTVSKYGRLSDALAKLRTVERYYDLQAGRPSPYYVDIIELKTTYRSLSGYESHLIKGVTFEVFCYSLPGQEEDLEFNFKASIRDEYVKGGWVQAQRLPWEYKSSWSIPAKVLGASDFANGVTSTYQYWIDTAASFFRLAYKCAPETQVVTVTASGIREKQVNRREAVERFLGNLATTRQLIESDQGSEVSELLLDVKQDRSDLSENINRIEASLRAKMTRFEALENEAWF
jgi:hypothetical protein